MIIITKSDRYGSHHITLSERSSRTVTVQKDTAFSNRLYRPATVNWSGCGSQPVSVTKEYVELLKHALRMAQELDEDYPEGTEARADYVERTVAERVLTENTCEPPELISKITWWREPGKEAS